ncbi:hypothetical protein F4781DRAFT_76630 [Annulohypoxylon bovei var. microspora]|nr:hypothetical protein F4781DRAFT_76630 [Annulohypoxylon bovei var. microspora]
MAIIPELPGVEVTINIRGQTAAEYDDPKTLERQQEKNKSIGTKIYSKFIECEDDVPFKICLKVTDTYPWGYKNHSLSIRGYIDGEWVGSKVCCEQKTHHGDWEPSISRRIIRSRIGHGYVEQSFRFTSITKVDDANKVQYTHATRNVENMGTVDVSFYRVIVKQDIQNSKLTRQAPPGGIYLAEKALKGKTTSHGTGYSIPTKVLAPPRFVKSEKLAEDDGPIATFRFLYRSREALMQEEVIPRPQLGPDPQDYKTPSEPLVALAGLAQEQIEALAIERLQQKHDSANFMHKRKRGEEENIKQEDNVAKHKYGQTIHPAKSPRLYKTTRMADGKEVIDLDSDD